MTIARQLLREARPKQWLKNVLVFAAPGAAGVLDDWTYIWKSSVLFAALCLAASGTYYWNDILDVEQDRQHPKKCKRPIASGVVPIGLARAAGSAMLVGSVGVAATVRWQAALVVAGYVLATTLYTTIFKHVAVVDLIVVASGFVLRAITGAVGVHVKMSTWFLLTTSFASLFIVAGKRFAELRELGDGAGTRAALDEYTLPFLNTVLTIACGAALVTYCIWAFDTKKLAGTNTPYYELSIVPMGTALLRYLLVLEQGRGAAPEEIFAHDRTLQVLGGLWAVVFGMGVYLR